jgi:glycosyltransferase involved in cell wall biosynthesis
METNTPKISLITVTFNSGKTLADTIRSVLSQTYSNYEYIIIDGNSQDDTIDIIKYYSSFFSNKLIWISEKDKGLYDAMNKGIKMATGDIIGILNSDDFFTDNNILGQVALSFKKHPNIHALYGDIHFVNPEKPSKCVRYYSSKIFKRSLMRLGFMPAHPSFYIKKECFNKYGLYKTDYKIAADFEFLLRVIFVHGISTLYLPIDMVTMRTGGSSTSGIKSHIQIMKEHIRACKENNVYTNSFILSLRYFYKIAEIIYTKIKKK